MQAWERTRRAVDHTQTAATAAAYQLSHPLQHSHHARPSCSQATHELSGACCSRRCGLIDAHAFQRTDLGYSLGTSFRYRLIRESLIFATFSAVGMGVGLYAGRLIREYIQ